MPPNALYYGDNLAVLAQAKKAMAIVRPYGCLLLCACFLLLGCDDNKSDKAKKAEEAKQAQAQEAEKRLLADPARATQELIRRLRTSIKVNDGLVIVNSPFGMGSFGGPGLFDGETIFPSNTPWIVSCGFGITVAFGALLSADFSSDSSRVSNDVRIVLTLAQLDKSQCDTIGVSIGRELRAILADH